ncbi:MAG: hypothetical protein SNJ55_06085 [Chloroherpetonaceae bacterium]
MQNLSVRVVGVLLLLMLAACGGKKEGDDKAKTSAPAESKSTAKEFLTEDIVKRVMGLDPSVKFEENPEDAYYKKLTEYNERSQKAAKEGKELNEPYPEKPTRPTYCIDRGALSGITFSYPKPNADEIRKKSQERGMEMAMGMLGTATQKGQKAAEKKAGKTLTDALIAPPESENVEVSFESYFNNMARETFESGTNRLRNGGNMMSQEALDKRIEEERKKGKDEATLKTMRNMLEGATKMDGDATLEDVSGVGDLATWSAKSRQLRVFFKNQSFAIRMDYKDSENKQKAIEIAQEVLKKM